MKSREYIICPAILRKEPKDCVRHYHDNDIYDIEIGYRHCDILQRFKSEVQTSPDAQGFYTSRGRFVRRDEAWDIAMYADQVAWDESIKNGTLFSEDLY